MTAAYDRIDRAIKEADHTLHKLGEMDTYELLDAWFEYQKEVRQVRLELERERGKR